MSQETASNDLNLTYFLFTLFCDQNCTVDPTQDVLKRLETLGEAFSQRFGQAVGPHCVVLGRQVRTNTQENAEQQWQDASYDEMI